MEYFIKTPINYTGNKYRILPQLMPYFPKDVNMMLDLFCGGATVGANVKSKKVVFVDNNARVIGLLKHFACCKDVDKLIIELIGLTEMYCLSCSGLNGYSVYKKRLTEQDSNNGLKEINKKGFNDLRDDYNSLSDKNTSEAYNMLYLLMVYGFNNDIRFSKDGRYNLPVGKTDLNMNNINKIKAFVQRMSLIEYEFLCEDFNSHQTSEYIQQSDFIYIDPPYLITHAVYNECNKWNISAEYKLLTLLDDLLKKDKRFMLSNVTEKKGIKNSLLTNWILKNNDAIKVIDIDYHYRSSSYNKKQRDSGEREIIILPR